MTSRKCSECGRILTDPESIKRGYGPDCAEKVSSNVAAIGATYGITAQQWAAIEANKPREARNIYAAHKAGRKQHVQVFLRAALG